MLEDAATQKAQELFPDETFKEMLEAGVFYGRNRNRLNPKMREYVLTNRGGVEIINLAKTIEALSRALEFLEEKIKAGGMVLFVATQPPAAMIEEVAREFGFPFVVHRWLGGTLTNFKVVSRRVEHLKKLRSDLASGALDKYTKKERADFDREIKRLEELLGGLEALARQPDVLVVIDPVLHETAVREARRIGASIIAFSNIDADPDVLSWNIPGNNKSRQSIQWFLGKVRDAIRSARLAAPPAPPVEKKAEGSAPAATLAL